MLPSRGTAAALAALGAIVLAACSTQPSPSVNAQSDWPSSVEDATPRPTATAGTPSAAPASELPIAQDPPSLALAPVVGSLRDPISVAATGTGWLLVNERSGRVIAVDPGSRASGVTLDISDSVLGGGEQGLLGLAVHPGWPEEPRAFVHYTDRNGDTVLAEFLGADTGDEPPSLDAGSEAVLLRQDQPFANHNGGQLAFGPDGYLWMGLGDGGSGGDPFGNGQNPEALLGKLLRLDVDAAGDDSADGPPYGIPPDNPFADGDGGAPEVAFYGLRNPWRFSFDRQTSDLWIGDVGQSAYEEVDRVDPAAGLGANFGWNVMEGAHCYRAAECATDGLTAPIAEYGRDLGCAVIGGFVYRGETMPKLRGWYLFSDSCSGLLFGIPSDAIGVIAPRVLLETGERVSAFGEDWAGELYLTSLSSGTLYRIVAADG
ncbi:MAG TPA: PQQ-dependent sugar dehydrogenase [Candidatus Limnocylindria bacterium]|nr:PQQ-dependent sugar dehydrogenase [Candidatus Limnocylindria bacterium]